MKRALAAVVATLLLVSSTALAGELEGWKVFHLPDDPLVGEPVAGEVAMTALIYDGTNWVPAGTVLIRPNHAQAGQTVCGPSIGPERDLG